jgi:transposase
LLQITPQMRIFLAVEPVDFRRQIDGLAAVCRGELGEDPFSGALFVFRSRRGHAIRVLVYDGQGYWLATKRLSRGRFRAWPLTESGRLRELEARELQILLWNGDPRAARAQADWRRLAPQGLRAVG